MPALSPNDHYSRTATRAKNPMQAKEPIEIVGVIHRPAGDSYLAPKLSLHATHINVGERERIAQEQDRSLAGIRFLAHVDHRRQFIAKTAHVTVDVRKAKAYREFQQQQSHQHTKQPD